MENICGKLVVVDGRSKPEKVISIKTITYIDGRKETILTLEDELKNKSFMLKPKSIKVIEYIKYFYMKDGCICRLDVRKGSKVIRGIGGSLIHPQEESKNISKEFGKRLAYMRALDMIEDGYYSRYYDIVKLVESHTINKSKNVG